MDIAFDQRPIESRNVVSFLRQWSALLPDIETQLGDAVHPARRALRSFLPRRWMTGDDWDLQQAAKLAGWCIFVPHG